MFYPPSPRWKGPERRRPAQRDGALIVLAICLLFALLVAAAAAGPHIVRLWSGA